MKGEGRRGEGWVSNSRAGVHQPGPGGMSD